MVSQFVSSHDVTLLGDINFMFPEGTHAIGRLDNHSEGLLLLTTNKKITRLLFQGSQPHKRTYLVLVKNKVSDENLELLRTGVSICVRGGEQYLSTPCDVEILTDPGLHFPPPYVLAGHVEYTWLRITLTEGKFHQVRKMVAAIRHKCRRLVRVSIEDLSLGDLQPGCVKEIPEQEFFTLLKLEK